MRILRKAMMGMSVGAIALAVAGGVNAEASVGTPTINATDQTMTVPNSIDDKGLTDGKTDASATEAFVSYDAAKYDKKNKKDVWNAKAKWDVYDIEQTAKADVKNNKPSVVTVDLSSLNIAKDNYIAVQDYKNADAVTVYKIPASTAKYSGAYKAGVLTLKNGKDVLKDGDLAGFEFKTLGATTWTAYDPESTNFAVYEQQGATLYFRKAAADFEWGDAVDDGTETTAANMSVQTAAAGNFAGKEFKVKIAKMGNGPAVAVDYVNRKLKTKDGQEWRAPTEEEWTDATKDGLAIPADEDGNIVAGTLEVRTKKTDKKAASKITVIKYKGITAPEVTEEGTVAGMTITVTKDTTNTKNKKVAGYVVFNNDKESSSTYLVYSDGKLIATVKPTGKDVKVAKTKFVDKKDVTIATAADAKNGLFQSPVAKLAEGGYDFTEEVAEDE